MHKYGCKTTCLDAIYANISPTLPPSHDGAEVRLHFLPFPLRAARPPFSRLGAPRRPVDTRLRDGHTSPAPPTPSGLPFPRSRSLPPAGSCPSSGGLWSGSACRTRARPKRRWRSPPPWCAGVVAWARSCSSRFVGRDKAGGGLRQRLFGGARVRRSHHQWMARPIAPATIRL
jgi:hypothetical protein